MNWMDIRIGQGYDVHALVEGRKLILGGVEIPHTRGLLGHSDADALLHAITDALFGAAGLGDIGRHFPDTDRAFAGADSRVLLREAVRRVHKAGYAVGNVDATSSRRSRNSRHMCLAWSPTSLRTWASRPSGATSRPRPTRSLALKARRKASSRRRWC